MSTHNASELKICGFQSAGCIRYIGMTSQTLARRLRGHLSEARSLGRRRNYRLNWLRSLEESPEIVCIESAVPNEAYAREQYWIGIAKEYGCRLVNGNDGGEGARNPSTETREKMAAAKRGRKQTPEHIAKAAAFHRGRKRSSETIRRMVVAQNNRSPEWREHIAAAKRGRPLPLETREKALAAIRGRKQSPEHIAKAAAGRRKKTLNGNN